MKRTRKTSAYTLAPEELAILEAAEKILQRRLKRHGEIRDPGACADYLKARCAHLDYEVFGVVFLDTRHRIIAAEELFRGTIDGAEVHPREVAKAALVHNAAAVILYHNHPSGNAEPSAADRAVTTRLKQALALLEVRVLDHFVVSGEGTTSFAQRGLL